MLDPRAGVRPGRVAGGARVDPGTLDLFRYSFRDELIMFARVMVAAAAGALVGWERGVSGHRAGIRTLMLVAMGSATFTVVSIEGFGEGGSFDPSRVAAQVATGVGFIGAGTIVLLGRTIRGLTTAAAIWVTAALGMAAGVGLYGLALGVALVTTIVLGLFPSIQPEDDGQGTE